MGLHLKERGRKDDEKKKKFTLVPTIRLAIQYWGTSPFVVFCDVQETCKLVCDFGPSPRILAPDLTCPCLLSSCVNEGTYFLNYMR